MNKEDFYRIMADYLFIKVGDIEHDDGIPKFRNTVFDKRFGYVYLWIEARAQEVSIVYVGKAGKTLKDRCNQHMGGFKNSSTGKKHAVRFNEGFNKGCTYEIYARKSDLETLFGEQDVSMECVEEIAFIKKFKPEWNSA